MWRVYVKCSIVWKRQAQEVDNSIKDCVQFYYLIIFWSFPVELHHFCSFCQLCLKWLIGCVVLVVLNGGYFYLLSGKGWYMYIETSYPRKPNDTAGLVSPTIQKAGSSACVLFWYHMFGPHVNALNVYMKVGNWNAMIIKKNKDITSCLFEVLQRASKFCVIHLGNYPRFAPYSLWQ